MYWKSYQIHPEALSGFLIAVMSIARQISGDFLPFIHEAMHDIRIHVELLSEFTLYWRDERLILALTPHAFRDFHGFLLSLGLIYVPPIPTESAEITNLVDLIDGNRIVIAIFAIPLLLSENPHCSPLDKWNHEICGE